VSPATLSASEAGGVERCCPFEGGNGVAFAIGCDPLGMRLGMTNAHERGLSWRMGSSSMVTSCPPDAAARVVVSLRTAAAVSKMAGAFVDPSRPLAILEKEVMNA
jgi:hypothetical protein